MTNKQKARVLCDWVSCAIDYDDDKVIHDAFVALQNEIGVCESYVAMYTCLCRMAGVPTWGIVGDTEEEDTDDETHIWAVQLDEEGNVFYTDPTWGDNEEITGRGVTLELFQDYYENRGQDAEELIELTAELGLDPDSIDTDEEDRYYSLYWNAPNYTYFWRDSLWDSHSAFYDITALTASAPAA